MKKRCRLQSSICLTQTFLILFLCTMISTTDTSKTNWNSGELEYILEKVFSSLERMANFFGKDYSSVNMDGLFGVRLGQGSVNQTIADCQNHQFHCPANLIKRLNSLNRFIDDIAKYAAPYVEAQDPDYFRHFWPTIDGPYILQYHSEVLQDVPSPTTMRKKYDEEAGDKCLSELMGRYKNEPKCSISNECWNLMTEENANDYSITHQLLYFIMGDKTGCIPALERRLKLSSNGGTLRKHETRLCAQIFAEAYHEVKNSHVNILAQDLFLEQCLLCGILGFQNFITPEWVDMVLSWQNSDGCFAIKPSLAGIEKEILELREEEKKLLNLMKQEASEIDHAAAVGRKLLREQFMNDNCLSHKTGLGFGLVGAYIRHFVRLLYGPPNLDH